MSLPILLAMLSIPNLTPEVKTCPNLSGLFSYVDNGDAGTIQIQQTKCSKIKITDQSLPDSAAEFKIDGEVHTSDQYEGYEYIARFLKNELVIKTGIEMRSSGLPDEAAQYTIEKYKLKNDGSILYSTDDGEDQGSLVLTPIKR